MANLGELQNNENESVSGSFKIRINGEDVGRLEEYYSKSGKEELILFNNLFAVTPKEKFRFRITSNPSEKILNFHLVYCGGHDIHCSVNMKILSFYSRLFEKLWYERLNLNLNELDIVKRYEGMKMETAKLTKDEFLSFSKSYQNGAITVHRDGCLIVELSIIVRKMDTFGSFLEPKISSTSSDLISMDVYHVICFNENGKKQKLSCPKYAVARYGECLVRHFENALNAEKPLVIKDFSAQTVKNFFFCLENQVLNYSGVTLDLAKMAHLYNVPSLFKACEKFLAETLEMNTEEFVENVETWIQFANTYNSVLFTSLISSFAERRAKNNTLPANWHTIIENNQSFAQLVGKLRLGLSIPPLAKYVVNKSDSIYLVCDDI